MKRNIVVSEAADLWIEDRPVEIVERKGIGHPDTLCDGIAERISVEYTRWCRDNLGAQLHHNFDKVQLVAGEVALDFGWGLLLKPIHIQIAGRGTTEAPDGRPVPMDVIAIDAAKAHMRETMRYLDPNRDCVIDCFAGRGDSQLVHIVDEVTANDTSFGVAHWPLSELEETVYETAQHLNYALLDSYPIGEDIKVMGARVGEKITLTCAVPFMAPAVQGIAQYRELKVEIGRAVHRFADRRNSRSTEVFVNTADQEDDDSAYLTLTGTSAECGDDGAVGRGNRVTGLITPFRPASLEAAAGKNPISHVGKLYNVLALDAAKAIVKQVNGLRQVEVLILSQIGRPIDRPLVATAAVYPEKGSLSLDTSQAAEAILDGYLANIDRLRVKLLSQEINLF
jgi:S-adenosylmethionine synthetase